MVHKSRNESYRLSVCSIELVVVFPAIILLGIFAWRIVMNVGTDGSTLYLILFWPLVSGGAFLGITATTLFRFVSDRGEFSKSDIGFLCLYVFGWTLFFMIGAIFGRSGGSEIASLAIGGIGLTVISILGLSYSATLRWRASL